MIQRALPNLRIISGALLSSPLCLETCDFKKISALIFFKCSSEFYGCRGKLKNMNSKGYQKQNKEFSINGFIFFNFFF